MERKTEDGLSVKIACAAGGKEVLRAATTMSYINSMEGLSEEEKAKFREQSSASSKRSFTFSTGTSSSGATAEPSPPAAPASPEAPDDLLGEEKHTSLFPFSTAMILNEDSCNAG